MRNRITDQSTPWPTATKVSWQLKSDLIGDCNRCCRLGRRSETRQKQSYGVFVFARVYVLNGTHTLRSAAKLAVSVALETKLDRWDNRFVAWPIILSQGTTSPNTERRRALQSDVCFAFLIETRNNLLLKARTICDSSAH
jgi:hypothetical protein